MRVVFVHPSHPNQFTGIAQGLADSAGWECALLVRDDFAESVRADNPSIAYYGYREGPAPISGNYYSQCLEEGMRCGKATVEALAHLKAGAGLDVVVGHASFGTTFFARRLLGVPVVAYVELPGYFPVFARAEFPAQYPQELMDVSLRALIHASVLQCDLCVVPSRHAKALFPRELQPKVRVQTEGFSLPAAIADKRALRRELEIEASAPLIGFAGRTLEAVRGFDTFYRVAREILQNRPDARFLVLGNEETIYGNESSYLGTKSFKQHVLESDPVAQAAFVFKPFLPHEKFIRHLQAMDVILFPLFEGAANWALFDAMAAGVPVLASNRCFVPEVITHGRDGLLLEADDVNGFARAALELLAQPERRAAMGRLARQKIARRFSLDKAVEGYRAIIQEAVGQSRRRGVASRPHAGRRTRRNKISHATVQRQTDCG
jgi:glycosyltransferase involved in cell wall biosynthesis